MGINVQRLISEHLQINIFDNRQYDTSIMILKTVFIFLAVESIESLSISVIIFLKIWES